MTATELPNQDIFKQYLLTLLREDVNFKYTLIEVLFNEIPLSVTKDRKEIATAQRVAFAKKHTIKPDVIKALQELFKDEPPASEIIKMIQK